MTRIKMLVLALFAVYWVILVVILVAARDVYDQALPQEAVRLAGNQQTGLRLRKSNDAVLIRDFRT